MKNIDAVDSQESPKINGLQNTDIERSPLLKNSPESEYNTIKENNQTNNDNSMDFTDTTNKFDLINMKNY